jgi:hypothetical protein
MKRTNPSARPFDIEVVPAETQSPVNLSKALQKKICTAPLAVAGTWDGARQWIAHAKRAHEFALTCQIMVGFELLALRESHGETRGRPAAENGEWNRRIAFEDVAVGETGLGRRTVFSLMAMAERSVPLLRKRSDLLRGFDPRSLPISSLPSPQLEALSSAVRKLTDGLTQSEFLVELGLAKAPQGSRTTGGARDRKAFLSPSEQAAARQELARQDWTLIERSLNTSGTRFLLLEDQDVRSQIDVLEVHLKARKEWVSKPREQRKPAAIEDLLKALQLPIA